jgi:hypothetical protein
MDYQVERIIAQRVIKTAYILLNEYYQHGEFYSKDLNWSSIYYNSTDLNIYHYTNLQVATKVIDNNDLYLFDSKSSNDLAKEEYGKLIFKKIIEFNQCDLKGIETIAYNGT